jgi:hypothetical protein
MMLMLLCLCGHLIRFFRIDDGCEQLGKQGACGALFRLTLESFGYTSVSKGTVTAFTEDLKHEGLVYRHFIITL